MAISFGSTGASSDLNAQVNLLAKMALQSGDHMGFFRRYLTSANPNRLAQGLAQGLVQQQMQGAETQQQLNPPQPPTVLDQKEQQLQQGMAAMPVARGMFDPSVYAQGGIGAGLGEEPQEQVQMARGGVVAFQEAGSVADKVAEYLAKNPTDAIANERVADERYKPMQPGEGFSKPETPEAKLAREARVTAAQERVAARATAEATPATSEASRPGPTQPAEPRPAPNQAELKAAEKVTKLDGKIESTVNKGKDPTRLIEQRRVLTEGIGARTPAPTVQATGIASPGSTTNAIVRAVTPGAQAPALPPTAAPAAAAAPAAPAAPGTPPPAAPAAPAAAAPKPGTLRYDWERLKAAAGRAGSKIPTKWEMVKGAGTRLGTAGLAYGVGTAAYDLTNAGIGALDTEGNFRNSVSETPFFQSAEAEQAAQNVTRPVPQSEIDAFRRQRNTWEGAAPDDSTMLKMIYGPESGGNPAAFNPLSGASGKGQLLERTFTAIQRKTPALKDYTWKDYQNNPEVQDVAATALLQDVKTTLKNKNIPITTANVYTAWFGGPKLAEADGKAKIETVFSKQEIAANPWVSGKTVEQVKQTLRQRMATANAPKGKSDVGRAVDLALQTPRNAAVALGADPNAAEAIPQTRQDWAEHLQRSLSPGQLIESGRTGLNAARRGTTNALEAMFGAKPSAPDAKLTAQQQYADILKNQQPAAAEPAAARDDKIFGMDRNRLGSFLMQAGAAGLANPSQYASVSLGKGLQAGFAADEAREGKIAERTAKAEEKANDRAEKLYKDDLDLAIATRKSNPILNFDQNPELQRAIAKLGVLNTMAPSMRRRVGVDDAELKRLQQLVAALSKVAPAAGGKGQEPNPGWGQAVQGKG